ncbi:MAG: hypothetical protein DMF41_05660 [Verrucomicrobia bacterium]|nr:MAG: hypothetical protein DMF41_05660 [Verrucomicrobiota bacterium]
MRIVFIGSGEIGVPTLQALQKSAEHELKAVITQPDKPVGRSQRIEPPPIKKVIIETSIPILQPARIKDRQVIEEIRALQPAVIVVMAYGQIFPRDVLEIPRIACLNLHASARFLEIACGRKRAADSARQHTCNLCVKAETRRWENRLVGASGSDREKSSGI